MDRSGKEAYEFLFLFSLDFFSVQHRMRLEVDISTGHIIPFPVFLLISLPCLVNFISLSRGASLELRYWSWC